MCGRTACTLSPEAIEQMYKIESEKWKDKAKYKPSFNVCPGKYQPIIQKDENGEKTITSMRWGLVPHWTKKEVSYSDFYNTMNARSETIATTPMYRSYVNKNRCILPVDGFFEWKQQGKVSGKQPYFISSLKKSSPLVFACLCSSYHDKIQDERINTYTIITTNINSELSWLHNRMPCILDDEKSIEKWLDTNLSFESVQHLLKPFDNKLNCFPVDSSMSNTKIDNENVIKPLKAKKITDFFSSPKKKVEHKRTSESNPVENKRFKKEEK